MIRAPTTVNGPFTAMVKESVVTSVDRRGRSRRQFAVQQNLAWASRRAGLHIQPVGGRGGGGG